MDVFISDGQTRKRISPATTDLQREIKAVLQELLEADGGAHYTFEVQKLTLGGDSLGRGVDLACKDVQITTAGTDVQLTIVDSAGSDVDGDAEGWLVPDVDAAGAVPIKVDNVGRLRFYGTAGAIIYILVRK
jgi:hypothetical protein